MLDYPVIPASTTSSIEVPVVTETQTVIFDRFWQADMGISARDPNAPVNATAMMTKGRKIKVTETVDIDGVPTEVTKDVWELSTAPEDTVYISIEDIFTLAETDMEVAQAIGAVLNLVVRFGRQQGKL